MTFVDTSALFAFLDRGAAHHDAVVRAMTPVLAVESHLADLRRRTSLVDHVSFTVMRERGIGEALALDGHFREAGFAVLP